MSGSLQATVLNTDAFLERTHLLTRPVVASKDRPVNVRPKLFENVVHAIKGQLRSPPLIGLYPGIRSCWIVTIANRSCRSSPYDLREVDRNPLESVCRYYKAVQADWECRRCAGLRYFRRRSTCASEPPSLENRKQYLRNWARSEPRLRTLHRRNYSGTETPTSGRKGLMRVYCAVPLTPQGTPFGPNQGFWRKRYRGRHLLQ